MRALKILAAASVTLASVADIASAQVPNAAAPAVTPPAAASAGPESFANVESGYILGLGDVIDVALIGRMEYAARARVSADGAVLLPLIGSLPAVNLKPADLAIQIGAALEKGGYYSKPIVRVEVVSVASRFVTVLGQVGQPGLIPLDRTYRLSEILARVGARFGGSSDYVILTHGDGRQDKLRMQDIASGGPDKDPPVASGDKIFIPAAENQVFYVSGSVRSPGAFPLSEGMTVRTALARAGGVNETGSEKKFEIFRDGKKIPKANLETVVEVGDIIKFGERMF